MTHLNHLAILDEKKFKEDCKCKGSKEIELQKFNIFSNHTHLFLGPNIFKEKSCNENYFYKVCTKVFVLQPAQSFVAKIINNYLQA